ncbi:hypothetical protein KC660_01795 [Candidatus Dojkabacteria bacterium]|uniref:Uncharacterized protein n=1 Tax=Candidatus Dojkabacteria bacterium TaxID=2099670 RepID=A0A955RHQ0_9BACT|nr:hypothetical protein [Candidatus Dojkabacteria bacterium]
MQVTEYETPQLQSRGNLIADLYNPAVEPETPIKSLFSEREANALLTTTARIIRELEPATTQGGWDRLVVFGYMYNTIYPLDTLHTPCDPNGFDVFQLRNIRYFLGIMNLVYSY